MRGPYQNGLISLRSSNYEKRIQKMSNLTKEITKTGGINRRLSARNNSSVKSSNRYDAVEEELTTDSIIVAGFLLCLAWVTVIS